MIPKADELWKEVLEDFFPLFLKFFHPTLFHDIIFEEGYKFLDKEFNTITGESTETKRFLDKLVQVRVKDGKERWILIHIEIQGYKEEDFSLRMFTYFYRIYDKYKKDIVSIAIFTDSSSYRPDKFSYELYGTRLLYEYNTYKILDYDDEFLKKDDNPFSLVVLSAKYALLAKNDEDRKLRFTRELIRLMYKKGKTKDEIVSLFKFISGILYVSDPLKKALIRDEIRKIEEVKKMPYISYVEEMAREEGLKKGLQEGLQEGLQKGLQEGLQMALKIKFGERGQEFYKKYIKEEKRIEKLEELMKKLENAKDIEDLM